METLELLVGLFAAVAVVVTLAGRTTVPEPVLLVALGLAVALIPGLPEVELDPELTLALFLPPLLYWAALHTDVRDLRSNLRTISLLAVGLVLVTTAAVALPFTSRTVPAGASAAAAAGVPMPRPCLAVATGAGVILGLAEAMSVVFLGGPYREVVGLILFLIVLLVRPQGLFGARA